MSGAAGRECTGGGGSRSSSFSSVSNASPTEVEEEFLRYHTNPLLGGPTTEMRDDGGVTGGPSDQPPLTVKKKRSLPGTPDPSAEVIALSPRTLMATNRFVCEICHKGFQRDQNLQLHRRGHNLPWKLRQRGGPGGGADGGGPPRKRVYVCPEASCVHHNPARALGDLTGIKKHYCRKHGEKKWKCERCAKRYAVHSDWKAHAKVCGTREYKCDCGTVFSRRDSFVTHRAFCDALAQENNKLSQPMNMATVASALQGQAPHHHHHHHLALPSSSQAADDHDNAAGDDDNDGDDFAIDTKSPQLRMLPAMSDSAAADNNNNNNPLFLPPPSMAGCMLSSLQQGGAARPAPPPPASYFSGGGKAAGLYDPSASSPASMSATALLQKAAEMGATAGGYGAGAGFSTVGFGPMMAGPSVMGLFGPVKTPAALSLEVYDGMPLGPTQLVGLDVGRLLPGQHHLYGSSHGHGVGIGSMTRAIGSLMHGGGQQAEQHRRPDDDTRVVDYLGVDDQRTCFSGVSPFGPHIGPWA
ncbi:Zinc finger protein MAGPIE [Zea mays]|uniref:Protein EARLY HEADING DATE 2 n=2 Tax=Zea mays TaxID=4577 RepID=C0PED3_MAIZE|nr:uncharacterized protein LOC100383235 [Zea mays]ACN33549.1 unknown [Zea mays]ONM34789.1 Protein indeterminate-domain 11 [Zea mays]PWZ29889.1 Zinc finger protein MAGPIE [Zea mays]|eukprot:NP_001169368.1 uncharacterized protein LOC100383235 [Zea mays]